MPSVIGTITVALEHLHKVLIDVGKCYDVILGER